MNAPNYPATVAEVLDDHARYKPEVLRAVREFKKLKPWRGSVEVRKAKLRYLHDRLSLIYRRRIPLMFDVGHRERPVGNGVCFRLGDDCAIVLIGKLSVVTYLHEFAHAIHGRSERKAVAWSVNLFRRVFPRQFARLRPNGHMLSAPVMAADSSLTGEVSRERQAEE